MKQRTDEILKKLCRNCFHKSEPFNNLAAITTTALALALRHGQQLKLKQHHCQNTIVTLLPNTACCSQREVIVSWQFLYSSTLRRKSLRE